jgi:hypothetical protein
MGGACRAVLINRPPRPLFVLPVVVSAFKIAADDRAFLLRLSAAPWASSAPALCVDTADMHNTALLELRFGSLNHANGEDIHSNGAFSDVTRSPDMSRTWAKRRE